MGDELPHVTIYTDGGCRPNPGPGGWAAIVLEEGEDPRELVGSDPDTTNNRMEITAAIEALEAIAEPHRVTLFTDSEYLRLGVTEWLEGWRRNGWRTKGKEAVKNRDLWERLSTELERHQVDWRWIKGHAGDRWNERADALASSAIPREPLPVDDPGAVHLFVAAAFSGKKDTGGWAALLSFADHEKLLSGGASGTSANRMHLQAAIAGLQGLRRWVRVHLYTTSDYLKDGATSWIRSWKSRGWKTRDGKPVAHRELWLEIEGLVARHDVTWHVVDRDHRPEEMQRAKSAAKAEL